ncbi:hypothetical protein KC19_8G068300 [Ceratodon purpureus]|uniref:Uncharacterized protein n=1 Tax=Ceratodon purpureus TaxID=3225 RepID=A0A8T0H0M6_CERPU|nr:hypothetical protein KC19_8G068300 [Ceratodon purpureus]
MLCLISGSFRSGVGVFLLVVRLQWGMDGYVDVDVNGEGRDVIVDSLNPPSDGVSIWA